ncbi:uncharacterized protein V1516DRAFT_486993 [Lipomyces oligophaga]|uniref:uncharacterized protein n=1 Tax=Lipomyces oligophaga TaxID=45792 RepID=UPI0034CD1965
MSDATDETYDQLLVRHKKEARDLNARVIGLKKNSKGDKKKKKQVFADCEKLENDLKDRHRRELSLFDSNGHLHHDQENKDSQEVLDKEENGDVDLLAQLLQQTSTISNQQSEPNSVQQDPIVVSGVPKKNRQKDRLARKQAAREALSREAALEASQAPDLRKIELENMAALTAALKLTEYDIPPDGHCLFASLADQLNTRLGLSPPTNSQKLRALAANHIRSHADHFAPYVLVEGAKDVPTYCDALENTPVWGGDPEILAIASEFHCPVNIVMAASPKLVINQDGQSKPLWIAYYKHSYGLGEHYNSLRDK